MGGITIAAPDVESQINLFHAANNIAWLKQNDSTDWARYTVFSENNWGTLRRYWDPMGSHFHSVVFAGQSHISEDMIFFGDIRYNVDLREDVNRSIERDPYAHDPFVLADSTQGDFQYLGPQVFVAFNQQLFESFYWGASVDYRVSRGLKNIYTQPEIISRDIQASIDFVYCPTPHLNIGLTWSPYQILDITKLVTQTDGQSPQTFRYRGFFEFRKSTGTADRTASYSGYHLRPQFSLQYERLKAIVYFNYHYHWHEIYDGTTTRYYEGSFQEEDLGLRSVLRFYFGETKKIVISLDYSYNYIESWAQEAKAELLINQRTFNNQYAKVGVSNQFTTIPLLVALEVEYLRLYPEEKDYLAHIDRSGSIDKYTLRVGMEFSPFHTWSLRAGYISRIYEEDESWNFFGDYSGNIVTAGLGIPFSNFNLELFSRYGELKSIDQGFRKRNIFDITVQLKHHF